MSTPPVPPEGYKNPPMILCVVCKSVVLAIYADRVVEFDINPMKYDTEKSRTFNMDDYREHSIVGMNREAATELVREINERHKAICVKR